MQTKTFDLKKMTVAIGPVTLGDFAKGDVIKVIRDEDTFKKEVGATGEVGRSKTNNRAGKITFSLLSTSPANAGMSAVMLSDEVSNGGIVPITIMDKGGADVHVAPECWIVKPPDAIYSNEVKDRAWVFDCSDVDMFFGGNK
jgi:hypothetical protein